MSIMLDNYLNTSIIAKMFKKLSSFTTYNLFVVLLRNNSDVKLFLRNIPERSLPKVFPKISKKPVYHGSPELIPLEMMLRGSFSTLSSIYDRDI